MLLGLFLSLLRLSFSDFNLFILQFLFTLCFALALLSFVKNTASNYFVIDANFDSTKMSSPVDAVPPCVVCSKAATKHCSACKLVRYCSAACQKSHWDSEHRRTCKSFQLSGKAILKPSGSVSQLKKSSIGRRLSYKNLNDPNQVLFSYAEFVELFNWEKTGNRPCGLLNCGNSCFANVVLQCLACTRPLVAYLLEKGHQRECWRNDWCFMCELQSHVTRATQTSQPFSPLNILARLPNIGGNFGYGKQEDAHEFMRIAIDTMQSVCLDEFGGEKVVPPRAQETTLIQHIFGGHLQSQVKCTKCNNVSNQFENMMDLTVEIQGDAASLEECLDQFTIMEHLHGDNMYKCDRCDDYVLALKRLTIRRAPNILTIALKRFQSGRFGKLNKRVSFPETLDLSPYMSEAGDDGDVYKLYAVVVHVDMLNASYFGHYICYTKDFSGNWYRIDDCKVYRVELDEVLSQGAYMLLYSRDCVRTSSLNPMEHGSKHEGKKLELAAEVVSSAKQAVEEFSAVDSTDVPIVSVPVPCLSNTISQEMDSGCEDAKDVEMADSEASSSALTDLEIHGSRCYNNAEESTDLEISEGQISEVSSSNITEPNNNNEPELAFPVSEVEDKDRAVQSEGIPHAVINSVDEKIEPYSNGVCENGIAGNSDACATLNAGEVLNDLHLCGNAEKVKETDMLPSQNTAVGAVKCNGRNSLVSKPKPLFASGFLEKRPPKKQSKEEVKAASSSRKQFANLEDGATSKFRDSYIPPMRSSGSIHLPCDSSDIGKTCLSVEETIPVRDSVAVNSTTAVVLNKAHCFNSDGDPERLEIEKSSLSLSVTKDVSAGGKDGRKLSGPKSKPLFRPGFLGKHPREQYSKQEAVVPAEIGNASFSSACKLNGISHQSTGDSNMGDSEDVYWEQK
ncbi:ubiquitin carboxyl-terminal hydrolase 19 [Apium graveolens]|uniref:ubiquitin carboxyl-terminal hydrolase 19 n=1 Tax=Apium graveolens TaxID=4045 RepID=UPI003D7B180F